MTALTPAQTVIARAMSEADLQTNVIDAARKYGWRVAHFRPARTDKGWRTPFEGDAGFPDLVMARDGKVLFVELKKLGGWKTTKPALKEEQLRWGNAFPKGSWGIWETDAWLNGDIERVLA